MNCIFCKIIAKEVPNYTVYEDEFVLAFLDIFPHAKGHTVAVPKKHVESLVDLTAEESQKLMVGLDSAFRRVNTVLKPDGVNIGINERPAAGQVVPHIHWHILPRYEGDGGGSVHSIIKNPGSVEVKELAKLFF
jgi:histidine triad (HIT) family protein